MTQRYKLIGPFAEAHEKLSDFSYNLFAACMIQESIDKLEEAQDAYHQAVSGALDDDVIARRKLELEAMQNSFYIAAQFSYTGDATQ